MKAFLCHSSHDTHYVSILAKKLGRSKVVYDNMNFQPGVDFRKEIEKHISTTSIFVFIASKSSIDSCWCKYELDEANYKNAASGQKLNFMTIIVDDDISLASLPAWLCRSKVIFQKRPSLAYRDILNLIFLNISSSRDNVFPFVGREDLIKSFSDDIVIKHPHSASGLFCISGLPGIGRRTFITKASLDKLSLNTGPFFIIDETRTLEDIYLWALDEIDELHNISDIKKEISEFNNLKLESKVEIIANKLRVFSENNCMPCFIDYGGLLSESGKYRNEYKMLIKLLLSYDDFYFAIIHERRPFIHDFDFQDLPIYEFHVSPLDPSSINLLLSQLLKPLKIDLEHSKLIVEHIDGYPPAARLAASYIKKYGIVALCSDTYTLEEFKAKTFQRLLHQIQYNDLQWKVLKYLAGESNLSISVISVALEIDTEDLVPMLKLFIDQSIVIKLGETFTISPPIKNSIFRITGYMTPNEYDNIKERLTKAFWSDPSISPDIEVVDATLHAVGRGTDDDNIADYDDLLRASILHQIANEHYHNRKWKKAISYAERALKFASNTKEIKHLLFRAYVQNEMVTEAQFLLDEFKSTNDIKQYYLEGFLLKKRHKTSDAINSFKTARRVGDNSIPVLRDLADCLYLNGEFEEANEIISQVAAKGNPYILDLKAKIAIANGLNDLALSSLSELERVDVNQQFIFHRRSRYYQSIDNFEEALRDAESACQVNNVPFEAFAQKANILIQLEKTSDAEVVLDEIQKKFRRLKYDVQKGLRCKLFIKERNWKEAQSIWNELENKTSKIHMALKRRILQLKINDTNLSLYERKLVNDELQDLEQVLSSIDEIRFENEI